MKYGPVISLVLLFALIDILVLLAKQDSGKLRCLATALITFVFVFTFKVFTSVIQCCRLI